MRLDRAAEQLAGDSSNNARYLVALISLLKGYQWAELRARTEQLNSDNPTLAALALAAKQRDAKKCAKALLDLADDVGVSDYQSGPAAQALRPTVDDEDALREYAKRKLGSGGDGRGRGGSGGGGGDA